MLFRSKLLHVCNFDVSGDDILHSETRRADAFFDLHYCTFVISMSRAMTFYTLKSEELMLFRSKLLYVCNFDVSGNDLLHSETKGG